MNTKMRTIVLVCLCFVCLMTLMANAEEQSAKGFGIHLGDTGIWARFLIGLGFYGGGDTLAEGKIHYVDSHGRHQRTRDFKIKAGGRGHIHAGMLFEWPQNHSRS